MAWDEVTAAAEGRAELQLAWRNEFGQYSGFLHAGIVGALIDTACGFAAVTITATVLASHYSSEFFQAGGRGAIHRSGQDCEAGQAANLLPCRGLWRPRRGQAAARQRRNDFDDGCMRAAARRSLASPPCGDGWGSLRALLPLLHPTQTSRASFARLGPQGGGE